MKATAIIKINTPKFDAIEEDIIDEIRLNFNDFMAVTHNGKRLVIVWGEEDEILTLAWDFGLVDFWKHYSRLGLVSLEVKK